MEQAHFPINNQPINDQIDSGQVISIDRSVRWQICRRLQELDIPSECLADGRLRIRANSPVALMQVRSVLQQGLMSRPVLISQLEKCWQLSN